MKTSRQQILDYVQAQRVVTASDVSRALHMTAANARHHLAILQEQGRIDRVGQRPVRGKGRPAALFALSKTYLGNNLEALSIALLGEIIQQAENLGEPDAILKRVAARLAASMRSSELQQDGTHAGDDRLGNEANSLTWRLYKATQALERCNYQARWEAHIQGPRLILGHCPYGSVLSQHPELCRLDAYLLEGLLNERLKQKARLERDGRGVQYCIFQVIARAQGGEP